jgi:epoxyqueuosine reductase
MFSRKEMTERIRRQALALGFDACGIVRAEPLEEEHSRLLAWLMDGRHAGMDYMARNTEKRLDPTKLVPGSKSVIVVLLNYYPGEKIYPAGEDIPRISRYALGRDYHKVMRRKLKDLLKWINDELAPAEGRVFVDSAPVLERAWARRAGLGWTGKNSLLLTQKGSWFFIGEIITDLELSYDTAEVADRCGSCTRCVEACPTQAILPERTVDANRCISYWTIEYKGEEFPEGMPGLHGQAFGCDICQEVCPWNSKAVPHKTPDFEPQKERLTLTRDDWQKMTGEEFTELFAGTPVMRTGLKGMKRNIKTDKS